MKVPSLFYLPLLSTFVAIPSIGLLFSVFTASAQAQAIPIANAGFEGNVLNCAPGCYQVNVVPGWTTMNETSTFKPTIGPGGQFPGGVPDGVNVAAAGDSSGSGMLVQDLGVAPLANTTYTLTAFIGQRADLSLTAYTMELLIGTTSVASDATLRPPKGVFVLDTVTYTTGSNPGAGHLFIRLTGSGGGQVCFDKVALTATSPTSPLPIISSGGISSATAFGGFSSVAPGSWIEIYGSNLASTTRSWAGTDFNAGTAPQALSGTMVAIGGQSAFIDYISPTQVNVQVPSTVATGQQSLVVTTSAGTSAAYAITVNQTEPGLLAPPSFVLSGK